MLENECVVKTDAEINSFAMRVRLPCRSRVEDKIFLPSFYCPQPYLRPSDFEISGKSGYSSVLFS